MALLDQLQKDLVAAMKAKDEAKLSTVRMIKTALQKATVADPSKPLTEAAEQQILKSLVKQRIDAADMFRKGGREELAVKEESERVLIESYLPSAATDEEIDRAVGEPSRRPARPTPNRWASSSKPHRPGSPAKPSTENPSARK